jgi:hypothetical protein
MPCCRDILYCLCRKAASSGKALPHGTVARAASGLDLVAVDAGSTASGGTALCNLIAAVVVDVEDVESMNKTWDETQNREEDVDDEVWRVS